VKGKNAALWTVRKPPTDGEMTAGIRSALDRCPVIELYKNGPPGPNQMWVRYDYQLLMRVAEVLPPLTPYMTYAQVTWPPMEVYSSPDVMTAVWRAAGSMQHPAKVLAEVSNTARGMVYGVKCYVGCERGSHLRLSSMHIQRDL
jgi:hypothetical protein